MPLTNTLLWCAFHFHDSVLFVTIWISIMRSSLTPVFTWILLININTFKVKEFNRAALIPLWRGYNQLMIDSLLARPLLLLLKFPCFSMSRNWTAGRSRFINPLYVRVITSAITNIKLYCCHIIHVKHIIGRVMKSNSLSKRDGFLIRQLLIHAVQRLCLLVTNGAEGTPKSFKLASQSNYFINPIKLATCRSGNIPFIALLNKTWCHRKSLYERPSIFPPDAKRPKASAFSCE